MDKKSRFVYCTRYLRYGLLVSGLGPIREENGKVSFKWRDSRVLYSVVLFLLSISFTTKFLYVNRINKMLSSLHNFDQAVINAMFLSFGKTQYFFPIAAWFSSKALVQYYNMWTEYEDKYYKRFRDHMGLHFLEGLIKRFMVMILLQTIFLIYGQLFFLPTYMLRESVGYFPSCIQNFLFIGAMHINCSAVAKASDQLKRKMMIAFAQRHVTKEIVLIYKHFWTDLSNITQQIGVVFSGALAIGLLGSTIDLIISGYGYINFFMTRLRTGSDVMTLHEIGMIIASLISMAMIITYNNSCYMATQKVEEFIDCLLMAGTRPYHPIVKREIDQFLDVIRYNRPNISIFGCVTLNRRLITKIISFIMTYLVVMVQFKLGFVQTKN